MARLLYEKKENIGWIRLNRPEVRNAVNAEEIARIVEVLNEAIADDDVKVIVVSSVGEVFCAGDDLNEGLQEYKDIDSGKTSIIKLIETKTEDLQRIARVMRQAPKIIIAATRGYAVGAGCEIAVDCDLIVAADNTQFGFPELRAGLSITGGITKILPMTVGLAKAMEMCVVGEFIDAQEAHRIGLVNKVVPLGEEEAAAEKLAKTIMKRAPLSVIAHKRLVYQSVDSDLETALNLEKQTIGLLCTSEDTLEAIKAFNEKRNPVFKGR